MGNDKRAAEKARGGGTSRGRRLHWGILFPLTAVAVPQPRPAQMAELKQQLFQTRKNWASSCTKPGLDPQQPLVSLLGRGPGIHPRWERAGRCSICLHPKDPMLPPWSWHRNKVLRVVDSLDAVVSSVGS